MTDAPDTFATSTPTPADPLARYPEATRDAIATLRDWIDNCAPGRMVFFGGAGVSTESGIPDFRSADGLYAERLPVPPEVIISRGYFDAHPAEFFAYYTSRMIARDARPNAAHRKLAELEARGTLRAVITQNIDGLHQAAGSVNVLELHGSVLRNRCMRCGAKYGLEEFLAACGAADDGVPRCSQCRGARGGRGGIIKPEVVLYEESLDDDVVEESLRAIRAADLLVIAGTSLAVWPAAGLVEYFRGSHLAIVNRGATPRDSAADLVIRANVGDVFSW